MSDLAPAWARELARRLAREAPARLARAAPPEDGSGRPSAVLIALTDTGTGAGVLLIERAADMRTHAGQVAFPGGASDAGDADEVATALREAQEEVGLDPASVEVLSTLPKLFLPPSGFVITPVFAWWTHPHAVTSIDAREVARVEIVPLDELAEPANRFTVAHPSGHVGPGFTAAGLFIWGFTASLLDRLVSAGGWERPWDAARRLPLPAQFVPGPLGNVTP